MVACGIEHTIALAKILNDVEIVSDHKIDEFKIDLYNNFPNPFSDDTDIKFDVSDPSVIKLTISDVLVSEIAILKQGYVDEGTHSVMLKATEINLQSGVYFYTLSSNGFSSTKAIVILK